LLQTIIQDHQQTIKPTTTRTTVQDSVDSKHLSTPVSVPLATSSSTHQLPDTTDTTHALVRSLLPIHAKLFEKHRVTELKAFLRQLLTKQIAFHARSLEAYSQLLECLSEIEDIDTEGSQ
jgi:hypothetical protein